MAMLLLYLWAIIGFSGGDKRIGSIGSDSLIVFNGDASLAGYIVYDTSSTGRIRPTFLRGTRSCRYR